MGDTVVLQNFPSFDTLLHDRALYFPKSYFARCKTCLMMVQKVPNHGFMVQKGAQKVHGSRADKG